MPEAPCPRCGAPHEIGADFCPVCHKRLGPLGSSLSVRQAVLLALLIVAAIIVLGAWRAGFLG